MATTSAASRPLSVDAIERLRWTTSGVVVRPSDVGYDASRSVWNAMIDHRPALIVEPASTADIVATVRFARDHGLPSPSGAVATTPPGWPSATTVS